jgi:hypothetical protein
LERFYWHDCNKSYYIHKVWICGILQSDWFSTSRILAHILLVEKNKMAAQTAEFPTFCERENCKLFAFYSLYRIKNTIKKLPQIVYRLSSEFLKFKMVKNIYFWKSNRPKERRQKHKQNRKILKISEEQSLWIQTLCI